MTEKKDRSRKDEPNVAAQAEEEAQTASEVQDEQAQIGQEELQALCQEKICPECPEKKAMDNEILRVKADADNFRKRLSREKEQQCTYATQALMEDIIPVIDNLELALGHGLKVEACKDLVQGVQMTLKIMQDTLGKHGLKQIDCSEGECFDPAWHEALAEEPRNDMESGLICQVMQKGYSLHDRVIRPAKVMVSKNC